MTIQLPKRYKHLIGQIPEEDLVLVAYLHHVKKQYPEYDYYSIWTYDISVILGILRPGITPASYFKNLTKVFRVAYVSDNKVDIKFINWEPEEVEYTLTSFRNVILWSYILDQDSLGEHEHNKPYHRYVAMARPDIRHLVSALKTQFREYDRN